MAIATGPIVQESTNVRYVTDSMPEPHVPGPLNKAPRVISIKENQKLPLILPTPIKVKVMDNYLEGYNPEDRNFIVHGFSKGFPLGVEGFIPPSISPNQQSALAHPEFIEDKLKKELSLNRIKGPYKSPPFDNFKVSPLGVVPKKRA